MTSKITGPYRVMNIGVNGNVYRVVKVNEGNAHTEVNEGKTYLKYGSAYSANYRLNKTWMEEQATAYNPEIEKDVMESTPAPSQEDTPVQEARPIVEQGMYRASDTPGTLSVVNVGTWKQKEQRVLSCVSCQWLEGDGEDIDSGYFIQYAEPTDTEKQTPEYQRFQKRIDDEAQHRAALETEREEGRQASLAAITATQPDFDPAHNDDDLLAFLFAGTSDN